MTDDQTPCCECGGNIITCTCDSSLPVVPTPEEAKDWPLYYLWAEKVKAGDYLIVMSEFQKVERVKSFKPYTSIQIVARSASGPINYARTNKHRPYDQFWVLVKPTDEES
jgi:hypothetical protein